MTAAVPHDPDFQDLRLPSIDGLRAFEAAARLGTFERAADELAITASAVGKRVGTLEDLLGTPLFTRTGRALALTVAGREYLAQVRTALGLLAAMPLHRRAAQRRQRLRITAPPTFARQILLPALPGFTEAHPELDVEIALSIPFLGGQGADTDVEIGQGPDVPDPTTGESTALMLDVLWPLAAPALRARLCASVGPQPTPAAVMTLPLLRTPIDLWAPWQRAQGLPEQEPETGARLVDLGLVIEAAELGQGVALARPTLAEAALRRGTLVPLLPARCALPAAHHYRLHPHAAEGGAEAFARWLRGVCRAAQQRASEFLSGHA